MKFDITRRKDSLTRLYEGAVFVDDYVPYPDKLDQTNDELINDESDEEGPYAGLLFVVDGPGRWDGLPPAIPGRRWFYRDNLEEFVRVRFDGTRPSGNQLDGSRASDKFKWYSHSYIQVVGALWERAPTFNDIGPGQNFNNP